MNMPQIVKRKAKSVWIFFIFISIFLTTAKNLNAGEVSCESWVPRSGRSPLYIYSFGMNNPQNTVLMYIERNRIDEGLYIYWCKDRSSLFLPRQSTRSGNCKDGFIRGDSPNIKLLGGSRMQVTILMDLYQQIGKCYSSHIEFADGRTIKKFVRSR